MCVLSLQVYTYNQIVKFNFFVDPDTVEHDFNNVIDRVLLFHCPSTLLYRNTHNSV